MAKIAKSKDTANYRKGKDLQVGDIVKVHTVIDGVHGSIFSAITEYLGKVPYMGVTNHKFMTESGNTLLVGGGEFAQGQF